MLKNRSPRLLAAATSLVKSLVLDLALDLAPLTRSLFIFATLTMSSLFSTNCYAAAGTGSHSTSGLTGRILGTFVTGTAQSSNGTSIPSRTMLGGSGGLLLGYAFSWIEPILLAEYQYLGQTTDPSSVSSQNVAGSGLRLGAGANFNFGGWSLAAVYEPSGTYKLSKTTSSGGSSSYTTPTGYHILLGYHLTASYDVGLTYSKNNYSSNTADGTTTSITSNTFNLTTYGAFASYRLF